MESQLQDFGSLNKDPPLLLFLSLFFLLSSRANSAKEIEASSKSSLPSASSSSVSKYSGCTAAVRRLPYDHAACCCPRRLEHRVCASHLDGLHAVDASSVLP
ncbi:hypothetical protein Scep_007756 [Stephania cephalantha]|uniref:Uncharacterized protein n=1 Tax=Stephania cephalantha TaxID=152367 RepID=A0AAP0KCF7_9MAGN